MSQPDFTKDTRTFAERRAEIDVLMAEYEEAIAAAARWVADRKARGFQCVREKSVPRETKHTEAA